MAREKGELCRDKRLIAASIVIIKKSEEKHFPFCVLFLSHLRSSPLSFSPSLLLHARTHAGPEKQTHARFFASADVAPGRNRQGGDGDERTASFETASSPSSIAFDGAGIDDEDAFFCRDRRTHLASCSQTSNGSGCISFVCCSRRCVERQDGAFLKEFIESPKEKNEALKKESRWSFKKRS